MRLIDADLLEPDADYDDGDYFAVSIAQIQNAPTIEPERKKGEWIRHYSRPNVYADSYWHCTECGYKNDNQYANVYHKFCPNCGADMREEGEHE